MGFCSTAVSTRVCTWTDVDVMPVGNTTDVGGVTMSPEPAVPPDVRFTVVSLVGATDALITKVAGAALGDVVVHGLDGEHRRGRSRRDGGSEGGQGAVDVPARAGPRRLRRGRSDRQAG